MGSCQSFDGKPDSKQKGKPQILIKSFTWARDSHGLFDYESKNLAKNTIKNQNSGVLVRKRTEILFNRTLNESNGDTEARALMSLNVKEGNYWVQSLINNNRVKKSEKEKDEDYNNNDQSIWMVVKSFKSSSNHNRPGYKLTEGDLIKLGRIKFRVKEFRGSSQPNNEDKKPLPTPEKIGVSDHQEKNLKTVEELPDWDETRRRGSKISVAGSNKSVAQTCRICLGEESDADDPFFCPCNCSGTMKYIHVLCLQKWLKGKLHTKQTGFSTSIYWKTLECELCKVTYPSSFTVNNKKYDIVEIVRPECAFIMLEILSKEKNILRGIHIIKMEGKNCVKLGRGHDSDIRITDISVSRCHALIKLDRGNYFLEDNNSKFGTLVHLKNPFPLSGDFNNISLQIGRSVITLSVKKNWKTLPNCFGGNVRDPTEINDDEMSPIIESHNDEIPDNGLDRGRTAAVELANNIANYDEENNDSNEDHNEEDAADQEEQDEDGEQSASDIPNDEEGPNDGEEEHQEDEQNPENQENHAQNAENLEHNAQNDGPHEQNIPQAQDETVPDQNEAPPLVVEQTQENIPLIAEHQNQEEVQHHSNENDTHIVENVPN